MPVGLSGKWGTPWVCAGGEELLDQQETPTSAFASCRRFSAWSHNLTNRGSSIYSLLNLFTPVGRAGSANETATDSSAERDPAWLGVTLIGREALHAWCALNQSS